MKCCARGCGEEAAFFEELLGVDGIRYSDCAGGKDLGSGKSYYCKDHFDRIDFDDEFSRRVECLLPIDPFKNLEHLHRFTQNFSTCLGNFKEKYFLPDGVEPISNRSWW
jgi:hypothetical protein